MNENNTMKERLITLYKLNRIDKELMELNSLKGDIPVKIEELSEEKHSLVEKITELVDELNGLIDNEKMILAENETLSDMIDKDDNLLRSGAVKNNTEYNALAREIENAYDKIDSNDKVIDAQYNGKKTKIATEIDELKLKLDEINVTLKQNEEELLELNKQSQEEEDELKKRRDNMARLINADDLEFYERINQAKYGDAMAIVRKGSCLGCFNSIPPQRSIEIRTANRFFNCEACGRILIAEEIIPE